MAADPLGGEALRDEAAPAHVLGRVEFDHHRQRRELGPDALGARERLGVDRGLLDGGVAGGGPQVVGLVVVDGRVGPHPGVGVVGLPPVERAAHQVDSEARGGGGHGGDDIDPGG